MAAIKALVIRQYQWGRSPRTYWRRVYMRFALALALPILGLTLLALAGGGGLRDTF